MTMQYQKLMFNCAIFQNNFIALTKALAKNYSQLFNLGRNKNCPKKTKRHIYSLSNDIHQAKLRKNPGKTF